MKSNTLTLFVVGILVVIIATTVFEGWLAAIVALIAALVVCYAAFDTWRTRRDRT